MDQRIIDLYDEYTHAPLPRRVFLDRLAKLAGGTAAAATLLPMLDNNYAQAAMIAKDDPRIAPAWLSFEGATGDVRAYLVKPKNAGKLPAVVVIHQNRGLNPHIEDVTRRIALEGFLAVGVDFLSPLGGTPADEDKARAMFGRLDTAETIANGLAAVDFAKSHAESTGKVAAIGFCWGGGLANQLAVHAPDLQAAVVYYGRQPSAADAAKIKARMLIHYGGLDRRLMAGKDAYEEALDKAGVDHQTFVYEGAQHAFNDDTAGARYNPGAAKVAWARTIAFLKETLA